LSTFVFFWPFARTCAACYNRSRDLRK
jgi:hypothetical protein